MRLFELNPLPKRAGMAALSWGKGLPQRNEEEITLPEDEEVQYFPLQKGEQFLILALHKGDHEVVPSQRLYFGGTDERPFLVEMEPKVLLALKRGEKGFYNALKPEGVEFCEQKFGTKAVRQGDWFAVPIPLKWDSVHGLLGLFSNDHKIVTKKEKGIPIGGTRHLLIEGQCVAFSYHHLGCTIIGEGLLRAPDHEDKILEGPHAFFQMKHLKKPIEAD